MHEVVGINEFAALGIRGLKSNNSVIKYRQAWEHAIEQGWAEAAEPGKRCVLPDQPFELPKLVHEKPETPPIPAGVVDRLWTFENLFDAVTDQEQDRLSIERYRRLAQRLNR